MIVSFYVSGVACCTTYDVTVFLSHGLYAAGFCAWVHIPTCRCLLACAHHVSVCALHRFMCNSFTDSYKKSIQAVVFQSFALFHMLLLKCFFASLTVQFLTFSIAFVLDQNMTFRLHGIQCNIEILACRAFFLCPWCMPASMFS